MRLIDADELIHLYFDDENGKPLFDFVPWEFIDNAPTIEAEPVKHGRWIKIAESEYECSACHEIQCCTSRFCGECGAKMDEVTE